MENLIHILFEPAAAEQLRGSFALDDIIAGQIMVFTDDLSAGPLRTPASYPGLETRKDWNRLILAAGAPDPTTADEELARELSERLTEDPNLEAWIWAARNPRDVSGWLRLAGTLRPFGARIQMLYLHNLPFLNEKGSVFYPTTLSQIPSKEFLKARKLASPVNAAAWESDQAEWDKQLEENRMLRQMDGVMTLKGLEASSQDAVLLSHCGATFQKSSRIALQVRDKSTLQVSISFLVWRLRELVQAAILESRGSALSPEVEVRLKTAIPPDQQSGPGSPAEEMAKTGNKDLS